LPLTLKGRPMPIDSLVVWQERDKQRLVRQYLCCCTSKASTMSAMVVGLTQVYRFM
jgi:hypothetical protein